MILTTARSQQVNDPNVQLRTAKDFHAISISGGFDVYLTHDGEEKVAVSASEEKNLKHITTEVKNGVLEIRWEHKGIDFGDKKLKAYISYKQIDNFSASGGCDIKIIGVLKTEDLKIVLSGASDLDGKLDTKNLSINISGACDMKVSGSAAKIDIDASGASSFKGFDFAVDYCSATASGASDIHITVNKELSANASGASDIRYKGSPVVGDIKTSGASSINRRS